MSLQNLVHIGWIYKDDNDHINFVDINSFINNIVSNDNRYEKVFKVEESKKDWSTTTDEFMR